MQAMLDIYNLSVKLKLDSSHCGIEPEINNYYCKALFGKINLI